MQNYNLQFKIGFLLSVFIIASLFLATQTVQAQGSIVPCGQKWGPRCEIGHIFILALNLYNFVLLWIATPLAGLIIVIGGILILISGGSGGSNPVTDVAIPNMYNQGKNMVTGAIYGIILIWGAWLIIHTILWTIGYGGPI